MSEWLKLLDTQLLSGESKNWLVENAQDQVSKISLYNAALIFQINLGKWDSGMDTL